MKKIYFLLIALLCSATMLNAATLTVKANNDAWGTVTGGGEYGYGYVTITATPADGYLFIGWYDENNVCVSSNLSYEIWMSYNDETFIAKFAEPVALTLNVETPGTLSELIFATGKRPIEVTKLTLTGTLDYDDFTLMRETMTSLIEVNLFNVTNTEGVNFSDKSILKKIVLPQNLISIDSEALFGCSLTSIEIPSSVTSIGSSAFANCSSLTSIEIPNNVTSIGYDAFYNCSSLLSVKIPSSITSIGTMAFLYCYKIHSVFISDIASWCKIYFGDSDSNPLSHGGDLYVNNQKVVNLIVPEGVSYINDNAFINYSSLTSVTIPNSVNRIGYSAFDGCSALSSVSLGNGVITIEENAFSNCDSLKSLTIPYSVEEIRHTAFSNTQLDTIVCFAGKTPTVGYFEYNPGGFYENLQDFENFDPTRCVLKVPSVLYNDYIRHAIWGKFVNIETMDIDYYKITATSNDTEMGYVVGSKYYLPNDTVKLEARPNLYNWAEAGGAIYYKFKQWSDGNTENPRVFVATEDVTLVAEFMIPPYEVTLTCDEAQGTVSGAGEYEPGTQVTITATAKEGYQFSHWALNYAWKRVYENPYTFEMGSQNYYIEAVFEKAKTEIDGIYYYLNNDTASVTSPNENVYYGDIVIPETITVNGNTYVVSYIEGGAFYGSYITSVNIPATIKKIGCSAFEDCNSLQIVKFNSSRAPEPLVSGICGAYSFFNLGYYNKKIIVPCGSIEAYTNTFGTSEYWYFTNAQYMLNVSANAENCYVEIQDNISCDDNEATIYASSYSDSYLLKQWSDGNTANPRTVTVTSDTTFVAEFSHCYTIETYYNYEQGTVTGSGKYTESDTAILVAIPNIGYEFDYWNVYIYNQYGWGYEYIGSTTGDTIKLTNIDNNYAYEAIFKVVPVLIDGIYYELKPNLTAYVYPHEYTGDIIIPSSVEYNGITYYIEGFYETTFMGTTITSLTVANTVNLNVPLDGCNHLQKVEANASFLKGLRPTTVKEIVVNGGYIDNDMLDYWKKLENLEILNLSDANNESFAQKAFWEYQEYVAWNEYGEEIIIKGDYYNFANIRKLVLPKDLTIIHERQFEGLWLLEKIVIPEGVTEIPDGAFYDCHALAKVELNENLTSIGNYAFYSCHALENIIIPEGVTEIGDAAFYGCNYADEIIIASSVQHIGNNAFALCNQVKRMEVHATTPPAIKAKTFYQVDRNIEFIVPTEARNAYAEDIYWCEFINKAPTNIENTNSNSPTIYTQGGMLYIEDVETDYNVFNASGKLIYTGRESTLSLPRGVYMIVVGNEVEKIVL